MTTREFAAIAERLDCLADEMRDVAKMLASNKAGTTIGPHVSMLDLTARRVSQILRRHLPYADNAMHLAGELESWRDIWRGWAELPSNQQIDAIRAVCLLYASRFIASRAQELRT